MNGREVAGLILGALLMAFLGWLAIVATIIILSPA